MNEKETTHTQEHTPIITQEEPRITLTLSHDAAVAIGVAATHYRVVLADLSEMAPTIAHLDEVSQLILQHPQFSSTSRAFLRDMRLMVAGLKDEGGA